MPTGTTSYGDVSPRVGIWLVSEMLEHVRPVEVLAKLGMVKPVPKNKGETVKLRRPVPFGAQTTPLTEGVTPLAQKMAYQDVSLTLSQYGMFTEVTDKIEDIHEDPVLKGASANVAEAMVETQEQILWAAVRAGTNVIYANGSSRSAVNTPVTLNSLRNAFRTLRAQRAGLINTTLAPSLEYNTAPVPAGYVAVGHTNLEADIRALGAAFTPYEKYGSDMKRISEYEIGAVERCRIILSPMLAGFSDAGGTAGSMLSTTGTNADVYPLIVMGKDAFGSFPLRGNSIEPKVLAPNIPRGGDPLGQRGTVGAKFWLGAKILNEAWMVRVECAASKL